MNTYLIANPLVRLWEAPVETLTMTGYLFGVLMLLVATAGICWRNAVTVKVQYDRRHQAGWGLVPPLAWQARVAAIPGILMLDCFAIAVAIHLLT